jgi:hypothetical protein
MRPPSIRAFSVLAVPAVLLALPLTAQTPFVPRPDLWVTDSANDRIARLADLDLDGHYDGPLESVVFYDDTLGPYPLSNNSCVLAEDDGSVLVGDTTTDVILRLIDVDGDGTAHGAAEAREYFTSVFNGSGVEAQAVNGLARSGAVVYAAVAQSGSSGRDFVLRLEDLNTDHDADDLGEAREYFVRSDMSVPGTSTGDSIVQDVAVGLDGRVYYLESGSTGVHAKGVYRLVDLDQNGVIDPAAEVFTRSPGCSSMASTAAPRCPSAAGRCASRRRGGGRRSRRPAAPPPATTARGRSRTTSTRASRPASIPRSCRPRRSWRNSGREIPAKRRRTHT